LTIEVGTDGLTFVTKIPVIALAKGSGVGQIARALSETTADQTIVDRTVDITQVAQVTRVTCAERFVVGVEPAFSSSSTHLVVVNRALDTLGALAVDLLVPRHAILAELTSVAGLTSTLGRVGCSVMGANTEARAIKSIE
jgi:hypothetical protein